VVYHLGRRLRAAGLLPLPAVVAAGFERSRRCCYCGRG
jgi:hypothetical protein